MVRTVEEGIVPTVARQVDARVPVIEPSKGGTDAKDSFIGLLRCGCVCSLYRCTLYRHWRPVEVLAQTTDTVLYEGARVIVGDGSAAIENAAILVENGKFTTVGQRGQVQAPAATRVDLTGKTVMPTLVNTHLHIGPGRGTPAFYDMQAGRQQYIEQLHALAYGGTAASTSMGWDNEAALQIRAEYLPNAARLLTSYRGAG